MKVKATQTGFIERLYQPGETFEVTKAQFSENWMVEVDAKGEPKKVQPKKVPKEAPAVETPPEPEAGGEA